MSAGKADGLIPHGRPRSSMQGGDAARATTILRMRFHGGGSGRIFLGYVDSKAEELKPRPLGELIHDERVGENVHFDASHIGAGAPVGKMA